MLKDKVDRLISEYGTNNPFELAEFLDITVQFRPLGKLNGYYLSSNGAKIVTINSDIPRQLQTFVLAHEIGHLTLHPTLNSFMLKNTFFSTDRQEIEADTFALCLLLTDKQIIDSPDYTIDNWATVYGLPSKLMRLRFNAR